MLFLYQACPACKKLSLILRKLETEAPLLWNIWQGREDLEELLFASSWQEAMQVDLSSFLGQEDILHPWMVLDFFKGWPV